MITIAKSKLFSRYLPLTLSVIARSQTTTLSDEASAKSEAILSWIDCRAI